jgi:hypothetical protein
MSTLREDTGVYPLLVELAACLCTEMQASGGPELCYCGPVAGDVVLDHCGGDACDSNGCGGQAWVRFVDAYPSGAFPSPDNTLANCKTPMAYTVEVGVARCLPGGSANGATGYTPPTMSEQLEAMRIQTADVAAMRRAIQCCFGASDRDYVLGVYDQTLVNGGGCLGGMFRIVVWESF